MSWVNKSSICFRFVTDLMPDILTGCLAIDVRRKRFVSGNDPSLTLLQSVK